MADDRLTNNEIERFLGENYTEDSRIEDYMLDMDEDGLTAGQYKQILKTLSNIKMGERPDSYMDYADILYSVGDYYDNVDKEGYDHSKYIEHLFRTKKIPKELLELIPKVEY